MKYYKHSIIAFFALVILGVPWLITFYPESTDFIDHIFGYVNKNFSAVFMRHNVTINQLVTKYNEEPKKQSKIRILLVPGHEPNFGGTEYKDLKERELVVELSEYLEGFLKNNSHYEVIVARDKNSWNTDLENYFKKNWDDIIKFLKESKEETVHLINNGTISGLHSGVYHNIAPKDVAIRLYGINKWINENNIDIAIHIHFNDYPRYDNSTPGEYSGFTIYVPEKQYSNSTTTRAIATTVFKRLAKYNSPSNLPTERGGVVEDQELIAIGSNNTLDSPSMLIEYGYLYEPEFTDPKIRDSVLRDLAFETYLGLQDFFGGGNDVTLAFDTLMLPHKWNENLNKDSSNRDDVLALQTALVLEGLYPPVSKDKNDCPRSGRFGPCTMVALSDFQKKYGISGEKGIVGEKTRKILNTNYSYEFR